MSSTFGKIATLGQRAVSLGCVGITVAGIYTITQQVREIQTYGIRDPAENDAATSNVGRVQEGTNEPFFKDKK